jgi:hypothetical protein
MEAAIPQRAQFTAQAQTRRAVQKAGEPVLSELVMKPACGTRSRNRAGRRARDHFDLGY